MVGGLSLLMAKKSLTTLGPNGSVRHPHAAAFAMRLGKLLIVVMTLPALAGCATHYHMPRESEPHATLTFDKGGGILGVHATAVRLNGGRYTNHLIAYRRAFRIGVGTMRLELGEGTEDLLTSASFTCELSFEAEAGRRYLATMRAEGDQSSCQ